LPAPDGGIPAIRVLPTFSKSDEKAGRSHCPFCICGNRTQANGCPRFCCHRRGSRSTRDHTSHERIGTVISPLSPCGNARGSSPSKYGPWGDWGKSSMPSKSIRTIANAPWGRKRSEEHTSELQSRSDLVCRLLLEQKKEPCRSELGVRFGTGVGRSSAAQRSAVLACVSSAEAGRLRADRSYHSPGCAACLSRRQCG